MGWGCWGCRGVGPAGLSPLQDLIWEEGFVLQQRQGGQGDKVHGTTLSAQADHGTSSHGQDDCHPCDARGAAVGGTGAASAPGWVWGSVRDPRPALLHSYIPISLSAGQDQGQPQCRQQLQPLITPRPCQHHKNPELFLHSASQLRSEEHPSGENTTTERTLATTPPRQTGCSPAPFPAGTGTAAAPRGSGSDPRAST